MRNSITIFVSLLVLVCSLSTKQVLAQIGNPSQQSQSKQERTLQELLDEVRQLRAILQRIEAHSFSAQLTLDRLRTQQEQVLRLTRELADLREKIIEVRTRQQRLKERVPEEEKQIASGVKGKHDLEMLTSEIEELKQREQNLGERETQLSADLEAAKSSVVNLNSRLDALELEIRSGVNPPARKQP